MILAIGKTLSHVWLLCMFSKIARGAPDFGKLVKRNAAMDIIGGILFSAKQNEHEAICVATNAGHAKAVQTASKLVMAKYVTANALQQVPPAMQTSIKDEVASVAKTKMCTSNNEIVAPANPFTPEPRLSSEPKLNDCAAAPTNLNAAKYRKAHMQEFDDEGKFIEKLFPSCECKGVKFIKDGGSGIVYRVKMNVDNVERAMKISACGTILREIGALQKLKAEPWVVQIYGWGREKNEKPQWDYFIMDLLASTVERAARNGVESSKLAEAARLTLEAARVMHTKYGMAHNDLKNDNIGLNANDPMHIKIFDFGQAAPVNKERDIAAFQDYWRMAENIKIGIRSNAATFNGFLDDAAEKMVFDGNEPAKGKDFPISSYLYDQFIDAFVTLGWATQDAKKNKKVECIIEGGLFTLH